MTKENHMLYICDVQEIINLSKGLSRYDFPHYQFILCTSGSGILVSEASLEAEISEGTLIFIKKDILFSLRNTSGNFCIKQLACNGDILSVYPQYFDFDSVTVFRNISNALNEQFNNIYNSYNAAGSNADTVLQLYNFIGTCGEQLIVEKNRPKTPTENMLSICNKYIRQNIDNIDLSVSDLCDYTAITGQELDKLYYDQYDMDVNNYIHRYRMEYAKILIIRKYDDYWQDLGYKDRHKFYKDFLIYAGVDPSEYLRIIRP